MMNLKSILKVTVSTLFISILLIGFFSAFSIAESTEEKGTTEQSNQNDFINVSDEEVNPFKVPDSLKRKAVFVDTFEEDTISNGNWVSSQDSKYQGQKVVWESHSDIQDTKIKGLQKKALVLAKPAQHYGVAHKLDIDNTDKDLVVQYELKFEDKMECGGSYVKLLQKEGLDDLNVFNNESPYVIMFGPDFCGSTNKVHFILRHQNPISKKWEEKHLKETPLIQNDGLTHLYTLIIRKDNSFEILIDNKQVKQGNLLESLEPSINPPKKIDDPNDKKPEDWVDEEYMPDPTATKPEDWDEDAPVEIIDPEDKKPEDWLDNEPKMIPDPTATKPEDWDDEEDGEWEAPLVPNPKCEKFGCGEWTPRRIKNPAYKGKWKAPSIKNPKYKGVWKPRLIDNPDYYEDKHPHNLYPIGAIAIEIWTMQKNTLFDNFFIGHDEKDASEFAKLTFEKKRVAEQAEMPEEDSISNTSSNEILEMFTKILSDYGILIAGTVGAVLISIPLLCCGRSKRSTPTTVISEKNEEDEEDEEDEVIENEIKEEEVKEEEEEITNDEKEEVKKEIEVKKEKSKPKRKTKKI